MKRLILVTVDTDDSADFDVMGYFMEMIDQMSSGEGYDMTYHTVTDDELMEFGGQEYIKYESEEE